LAKVAPCFLKYKSSQLPSSKNHHNYLQNYIKSTSTLSLANHQSSKIFLNISIAALKACAVTYSMHCERCISVPL